MSIGNFIIDYSAHDAWDFCPASWYEKYVLKRRKRWPKAQRSDALCLGSLVHAGLEVWQKTHTVEIPDESIDENTPDRETYLLAQELVHGYAQTYGEELWQLILCEEPLLFPVAEGVTGLAKIDAYFYVPEQTTIESGMEGLTFDLSPGWWIHEYKTKGPRQALALYLQKWNTDLQPSYQTLALSCHLNTTGRPEGFAGGDRIVQGVLINVLEKPDRYVPKRKCNTCNETYEFNTWVATGTGMYACPVCGTRRKITPLTEDIPHRPPHYFRVAITRTSEELLRDLNHIQLTAEDMRLMDRGGLFNAPWTKRNCVSMEYRRACDYYEPHRNGRTSLDDDQGYFTETRDYRGLIQLT